MVILEWTNGQTYKDMQLKVEKAFPIQNFLKDKWLLQKLVSMLSLEISSGLDTPLVSIEI